MPETEIFVAVYRKYSKIYYMETSWNIKVLVDVHRVYLLKEASIEIMPEIRLYN